MDSRLVLANIGHRNRNPRCDRAAVRILGVFDDLDAAKRHLQDAGTCDVDVHAAPVGDFFVLMRDPGQDEFGHRQRLLATHKRRLREHTEEFEANRVAQKAGEIRAQRRPNCEPLTIPADGEIARSVSRAMEVRMQRFAVVSILGDVEEADQDLKQPGVCIYEVFDSEAEAKTYVREVLGKRVLNYNLDVVALYEWLFPTNVDLNQVEEEYRVSELTEIMNHRKKEGQNVEAFRQLCAERGEVAPEIVIGEPAPAKALPVCTLNLGEGVEGTVTRFEN